MLSLSKLGRSAIVALGVVTFSAYELAPTPAAAWWNHGGWHGGWGWHHGWGFYHRGYWGGGWYGRVCPPGFHLGYWGHRCFPNY